MQSPPTMRQNLQAFDIRGSFKFNRTTAGLLTNASQKCGKYKLIS